MTEKEGGGRRKGRGKRGEEEGRDWIRLAQIHSVFAVFVIMPLRFIVNLQ